MIQPKFKFGQRVCVSKSSPFIIVRIEFVEEEQEYRYFDKGGEWAYESELTEVKEPMRVEFEHFVYESPNDKYYGQIVSDKISKFIGKKVLVTVEEILP